MFGFGRITQREQPSTARRKSGGTLRKAEYDRRRAAQANQARPRVRTREAEAARVASEYKQRRAQKWRKYLPFIVVCIVVVVLACVLLVRK